MDDDHVCTILTQMVGGYAECAFIHLLFHNLERHMAGKGLTKVEKEEGPLIMGRDNIGSSCMKKQRHQSGCLWPSQI